MMKITELEKQTRRNICLSDHENSVWKLYYKEHNYLKVLNKSASSDIKREYYELLRALKDFKQWNLNIASVLNVYGTGENFSAYMVEKMSGDSLFTYNQQESYQLFLEWIIKFIPILDFAEKEKIVFLDIFNPGNVLYDKKTKEINLIDIDSFQILNHFPVFLHSDLMKSSWFNSIFETDKYYSKGCFQTDLNTFFIYELFFRLVFCNSLLGIYFKDSSIIFNDMVNHFFTNTFQLNLKNKEVSKKMQVNCEKKIIEFLDMLGFSSKENIYGRIIDLSRPVKNTIDITDFQRMVELYQLKSFGNQTKLVRK